MAVVDLDAARAARAEAQPAAHSVRFHGQDYPLPAEIPMVVAELWAENRTHDGLTALLGEGAEAFWASGPSVDDCTALITGMAELYGFADVGESSASNGSSPKTSSRSRPTSPASTG